MADPVANTGEKLRAALQKPGDSFEIEFLIIEAARVGDRLDQLNRILSGDAELWARVTVGRDGTIDLRVDNALSEARQQASTLRQLLGEIRRHRTGSAPEEGDVLAGL